MFSHIPEKKASFHILVTWEDKYHNHKHLPIPFCYLKLFLLSKTWKGLDILLVHVAQLYQGCSLPMVGAEQETEKALMLCKHCPTVAKTPMCYQLCNVSVTNSKHSTVLSTVRHVNSMPGGSQYHFCSLLSTDDTCGLGSICCGNRLGQEGQHALLSWWHQNQLRLGHWALVWFFMNIILCWFWWLLLWYFHSTKWNHRNS